PHAQASLLQQRHLHRTTAVPATLQRAGGAERNGALRSQRGILGYRPGAMYQLFLAAVEVDAWLWKGGLRVVGGLVDVASSGRSAAGTPGVERSCVGQGEDIRERASPAASRRGLVMGHQSCQGEVGRTRPRPAYRGRRSGCDGTQAVRGGAVQGKGKRPDHPP